MEWSGLEGRWYGGKGVVGNGGFKGRKGWMEGRGDLGNGKRKGWQMRSV